MVLTSPRLQMEWFFFIFQRIYVQFSFGEIPGRRNIADGYLWPHHSDCKICGEGQGTLGKQYNVKLWGRQKFQTKITPCIKNAEKHADYVQGCNLLHDHKNCIVMALTSHVKYTCCVRCNVVQMLTIVLPSMCLQGIYSNKL